MTRLCLILFGISYYENYKHWSGMKTTIDFRLSIENYKEFIYKYFNNLGYDIDVYFATNIIDDNDIKQELLDTYKPINYIFLENIDNIIVSRNIKLKNAVECCMNKNIKYDICLITRFDLLFKNNFSDSNINLNKFNIVSMTQINNQICDNFYLFPYKLLYNFYNIICKNINVLAHDIFNDIKKVFDVNFILNEKKSIAKLSFYKINRTICYLPNYNRKNIIINNKKIYINGSKLLLIKK
jgi:hypothetical protein